MNILIKNSNVFDGKNENLKKKEYALKAALCKSCGYVELYVDINED